MTSFNCNHSFTYVLRVSILDVTKRREAISADSADTIRKETKNKPGISGCGSFVVAYFQPTTFIDRLPVYK